MDILTISDDINAAITEAIEKFKPINPITIQLARRLLNESFHDSFEDAIGHFLAAQQRAISQNTFLVHLVCHHTLQFFAIHLQW